MSAVTLGIIALVWGVSAEREHRHKMPEPHRFFPSRWYDPSSLPDTFTTSNSVYRWSRQIREHEKAAKSRPE